MKAEIKFNPDIDYTKLKNDLYQKMIKKQIEEIGKKWESNILFATNSSKQEVLNFEDIENAIKLLEKNKTQVILLNIDISNWFKDLFLSYNALTKELVTLMGIPIINYPYEKFNFYFHLALKEYDEIIWIPKEGKIYIIDSKKFLEFINK